MHTHTAMICSTETQVTPPHHSLHRLGRDEIMFTLTKTKKKQKNTLYPKNEQEKQASSAASEVEKYSSHKESIQKARHTRDWKM